MLRSVDQYLRAWFLSKFWICYLLSCVKWASYLMSLCLSLLICKMSMLIIVPVSWDFMYLSISVYIFKKILFIEKGERREKERERNISVWLPLRCPLLGTWPTTQACALTGNQTSDPLVYRPALSHWATPARAVYTFLCIHFYTTFSHLFLSGIYNRNVYTYTPLPTYMYIHI